MGTSCSKERENQPKETVSAEQMQGFMVNPVQQAKQQNSPQTSFQCKGLSEITHSLILEGSFVEGNSIYISDLKGENGMIEWIRLQPKLRPFSEVEEEELIFTRDTEEELPSLTTLLNHHTEEFICVDTKNNYVLKSEDVHCYIVAIFTPNISNLGLTCEQVQMKRSDQSMLALSKCVGRGEPRVLSVDVVCSKHTHNKFCRKGCSKIGQTIGAGGNNGDCREGEAVRAVVSLIGANESSSICRWYHAKAKEDTKIGTRVDADQVVQVETLCNMEDCEKEFIEAQCDGNQPQQDNLVFEEIPLECIVDCIDHDSKVQASNISLTSVYNHPMEITLNHNMIGYWLKFLITPIREDGKVGNTVESEAIGPVLPGLPQILSIKIQGIYEENSVLKADVVYRGGAEGDSEYWWIRCHPDGKREQIHEPSKDHKQYKVSLEDLGCTLKVKCKPIRSDGLEGPIETSKPTPVIAFPIPNISNLHVKCIPERSDKIHESVKATINEVIKSNGACTILEDTSDSEVLIQTGDLLHVLYTYNGSQEGKTWIRWFRSRQQTSPLREKLREWLFHRDSEMCDSKDCQVGVGEGVDVTYGLPRESRQDKMRLRTLRTLTSQSGFCIIPGADSGVYRCSADDVGRQLLLAIVPVRKDGVYGSLRVLRVGTVQMSLYAQELLLEAIELDLAQENANGEGETQSGFTFSGMLYIAQDFEEGNIDQNSASQESLQNADANTVDQTIQTRDEHENAENEDEREEMCSSNRDQDTSGISSEYYSQLEERETRLQVININFHISRQCLEIKSVGTLLNELSNSNPEVYLTIPWSQVQISASSKNCAVVLQQKSNFIDSQNEASQSIYSISQTRVLTIAFTSWSERDALLFMTSTIAWLS